MMNTREHSMTMRTKQRVRSPRVANLMPLKPKRTMIRILNGFKVDIYNMILSKVSLKPKLEVLLGTIHFHSIDGLFKADFAKLRSLLTNGFGLNE